MRYLTGFLVVSTIVAIIGSTSLVIFKEHGPKLSVQVVGVPEYIYYERPYEITLAYANHGAAVKGPVELTADLPPTFFLAGKHQGIEITEQHLVWQFDGLNKGESGTVTFTVQGVLPADLSKAVYNLPGYTGHTAFVEGFSLAVAMTAGSHATTAVAVADTGASTAPLGFLTIVKDTVPDYAANFTFTDNISGCDIGVLEDDGIGNGNEATCAITERTAITVRENDPAPQGFVLTDIACEDTQQVPAIAAIITPNIPDRSVTITFDNQDEIICTFTNIALLPGDPPVAPPTATPTATPTRTSTPTATATHTATPTATPEQRAGGLGGLFAPNPSPVPTQAVVAAIPPVVRPPSTGNGGLVR
jgi:hypothetical protein